jgi:aerobic-type carbon monoxide dehydrogenase small subunit (CoxS/CutS family)
LSQGNGSAAADGTRVAIRTTVNGIERTLEVPANRTLADLLREDLGLTGVKVSCELQICGACTVLLDDRSVSACTVLAIEADGASIRTVESLANGDELSPLQRAFIENGALQCGYCTPGFLMAATELLEHVASPTEAEIRHWLHGNICRCTGYRPIVAAVRQVVTGESGGH